MKYKVAFLLGWIAIVIHIGCVTEITLPDSKKDNNKVTETDQYGNDSTYTEPIVRILFVGNSLTYTNDLPSMVKAIATDNDILVETEMLAYPNYALEDHWLDGKFQKLTDEKYFNYVIVQQGPSSQQDGRTMLMEYGAKFKKVCDDKGTRLVFFMVWPSRTNYQTFSGVIKNYREAALQTESMLCPVGETWKAFIDNTHDFSYYGEDGFHPSPTGSAVAAQLIYQTLFTN